MHRQIRNTVLEIPMADQGRPWRSRPIKAALVSTKVERIPLQNVASTAGLLPAIDAPLATIKGNKKAPAGGPLGGGLDDMAY